MSGMREGDTAGAGDGAAAETARRSAADGAARGARGRPIDRALLFVAVAAVATLVVAASLRKIGPPDYWWQLATGEHVMRHGPPRADPFSYTRAGHEWVELHWLYCAGLHQFVRVFGARGATLVVPIVVGCALALLVSIAVTRRTAAAACAIVTLAILAGRFRFYARPEVVTFLFIAAYLWILTRFRARGGAAIFALPVLQVVWTNVQALSILGPCLAGAAAAASLLPLERDARDAHDARHAGHAGHAPLATRLDRRERGTLFFVFLATAGAMLVNPYGAKALTFPFVQFAHLRGTVFKAAMTEFVNPFAIAADFAPIRYYIALIAIAVATTLANVRRVDTFLLAAAAGLLYLSTLAARNVPLFALAAIPLILDNARKIAWPAAAISPRARALAARAAAGAIAAFALVSAWSLATNRAYVEENEIAEFGSGVAAETWPAGALAFAREHGVPEPLFAPLRESSFLLAHGYRVFIDPRLEVYGDAFFARYLRATAERGEWEAVAREYGIRSAMIGLESLETIDLLRAAPEWELVYFDAAAALFVRRGEAPSIPRLASAADFDAAIARLRSRLPRPREWESLGVVGAATHPHAYHLVADFLLQYGLAAQAEPFLRDAVAAYPRAARARVNLAMVLEARGDAAGAARELDAALRFAPGDPDVLCQAAVRLIERGDDAGAAALLDRAIAKRPSHALAWALRGEIHLEAGEPARAVACFERAALLAPAEPRFAERLAAARAAAGARAN